VRISPRNTQLPKRRLIRLVWFADPAEAAPLSQIALEDRAGLSTYHFASRELADERRECCQLLIDQSW